MITSRSILSAIALASFLGVVGSLSAQIQAGFLGRRTVSITGFLEDFDTSGIADGNGVSLAANLPLTSNFDLGLSGYHEWISTNSFREKQLAASVIAYYEMSGFKPFADISVGNVWQSSTVRGIRYSDNNGFYSFGAGVEAPISDSTALTARVGHSEYFDAALGGHWNYVFGISHWFTEKAAVLVSVNFRESDSLIYSFGVGVCF